MWIFLKLINLFIYGCVGSSFLCEGFLQLRQVGGPLLIAVRGPLIIAASLVAEHRLQMCRLSNCGSRAQLLRGMWDPPRPGLKPVSPALAGRFSTTAPPGKPLELIFVYGVKECSNFIDLHAAVQLSQRRLLKTLSFLYCIFLPPLSKIN